MTTFYVATRARYVLVEAANESEARKLGQPALQEFHAEVSARIGRELPVEIRVIRPATDDEIELEQWHREMSGNA
jgi:predicted Co/Zn/Cd cation transporter (cation efflux family)